MNRYPNEAVVRMAKRAVADILEWNCGSLDMFCERLKRDPQKYMEAVAQSMADEAALIANELIDLHRKEHPGKIINFRFDRSGN